MKRLTSLYFRCHSLLIICSGLCCALAALGQENPETGIQHSASLSGFVTDSISGERLAGAHISIDELNRGTTTRRSGYYVLTDLPAGQLRVRYSFVGFQSQEQLVILDAQTAHQMDVGLIPSAGTLGEVTVTAGPAIGEDTKDAGLALLGPETIMLLPSLFEPDVLRSMHRLPGISAVSDYSSNVHIRGGHPSDTQILIDGARVYNPTHAFGLFSTFNPDAVGAVHLHKGGYPANQGGSLGSVLDIRSKSGNRNELHGGISVGLLATRAYLEGPHPKGSYMLAIRRSTMGGLLRLFSGTIGVPESMRFYDVNAKVTFDLSRDDSFAVSGYRGADRTKLLVSDEIAFDMRYGNSTVAGQWIHFFSDKLHSTVTATYSRYYSAAQMLIGETTSRRNNHVDDTTIQGDLQYYSGARNDWELGWRLSRLAAPHRVETHSGLGYHWQPVVHYASLYIQDTYRPSRRWAIKAGVRATYLGEGTYFYAAPRLTISRFVGSSSRLQASLGRYYQQMTQVTDEVLAGLDYWLISGQGVRPAYGDQYVLGASMNLGSGVRLDAEAYFRTMRQLVRPSPFLSNMTDISYAERLLTGTGWASGLEMLLQRPRGRLFGFVSYTLGKTERTFPTINTQPDGQSAGYPPRFDRLHDWTLSVNYGLRRGWVLSGALTYATGQPVTVPTGRYALADVQHILGIGSFASVFETSGLNNSRLPPYHRLDAGIRKSGRLFQKAYYEIQLQVINAYARRNPWFTFYIVYLNGTLSAQEIPQIPVPLPNLTFTISM